MRAPVRPIRGRWPSWLEQRFARFVRRDPRDILDESIDPDAFRQAMSSFNVGDTIKITGANRHPDADALLVDSLSAHDLDDAGIVDIRASDGSTSLDLIRRLGGFKSYVIADLFLTLEAVRVGRRTLFFQADGTCVLVVGRAIAWPGQSRELARWFAPLITKTRSQSPGRQSVLLLNPSVRQHMAADPRVSYRVHDILQAWSGDAPDTIKVANLLRRLYFDDARIMLALRALLASVKDGGHLLIVDNPRRKNTPPRGGSTDARAIDSFRWRRPRATYCGRRGSTAGTDGTSCPRCWARPRPAKRSRWSTIRSDSRLGRTSWLGGWWRSASDPPGPGSTTPRLEVRPAGSGWLRLASSKPVWTPLEFSRQGRATSGGWATEHVVRGDVHQRGVRLSAGQGNALAALAVPLRGSGYGDYLLKLLDPTRSLSSQDLD